MHRCAKLALVMLLPVAAAAGGCSKKITILQIPAFYSKELRSIAVVPFSSAPGTRGSGEVISDDLAAALMANGTYKVYNRNDLKQLMDQRDLQLAFGDDTAAAAEQLNKLGNVQAMLVGTVTAYSATSNKQRKTEPVQQYDRRLKRMVVVGHRSYIHTRNEANVAVSARLIRLSDGTSIHATAIPARGQAWAQGSPPKMDPYACLARARQMVVAQLLQEFAVVRKTIKVDPSKALRTAGELYDNKWTFTKDFSVDDEKMYVVVELPAVADRNNFRLTIVRKDQREDLAEKQITWTRKNKSYGYRFDPGAIAAAGGGPGTYTVKFYSGPEPVMTTDFHLK